MKKVIFFILILLIGVFLPSCKDPIDELEFDKYASNIPIINKRVYANADNKNLQYFNNYLYGYGNYNAKTVIFRMNIETEKVDYIIEPFEDNYGYFACFIITETGIIFARPYSGIEQMANGYKTVQYTALFEYDFELNLIDIHKLEDQSLGAPKRMVLGENGYFGLITENGDTNYHSNFHILSQDFEIVYTYSDPVEDYRYIDMLYDEGEFVIAAWQIGDYYNYENIDSYLLRFNLEDGFLLFQQLDVIDNFSISAIRLESHNQYMLLGSSRVNSWQLIGYDINSNSEILETRDIDKDSEDEALVNHLMILDKDEEHYYFNAEIFYRRDDPYTVLLVTDLEFNQEEIIHLDSYAFCGVIVGDYIYVLTTDNHFKFMFSTYMYQIQKVLIN
ncbi:MAG: hypothetical protein KKG64_01960 [Firmicutes bacterium]|nr:hypothetical protein [Bacillota bacterium]